MALIRSYDLSDFCNSPPSDGFFYSNLQKGNNAGVAGKGNCAAEAKKKEEELRNCTVMGGVLSINQPSINRHLTRNLSDSAVYHQGAVVAGVNNMGGGQSGFCNSIGGDISASTTTPSIPDYLRPVASGFTTSAFSKQMSLGLNQQNMMNTTGGTGGEGGDGGKKGRMMHSASSANDVRSWTPNNQLCSTEHTEHLQSHPTDDSAPTPVDHIISTRTPTIVTTPAEEGGSGGSLIEKFGALNSSRSTTPDVTPSSTPAVTPACSPQVARRAGNPFFTGNTNEEDKNNSGSWLFRPGKKVGDGGTFQSEKLYETKVEFQTQPNSKITKKTVRYVPRPSELRELNFWSPTSM